MTGACQDFRLGSMLGTPKLFTLLGAGIGNSLFFIYVPDAGDIAQRTYILPNHPQGTETGYFTLRKQPIRTVSGYGEGNDRAEYLSSVLQASSRKPLYCWRRAHQWRMSPIPPASIGLYYIRIIILKCTLMLKKSLLQNFKATIKYSIVMAQLNGLAWENWGL